MNLWVLAFAGGVAGLDGTSFPQVMLSRPVVAGALMGWLLGIPVEGALLGAVLELFHLGILPIGATPYPEAGTAMVAAVWAYAVSGTTHGAGLLLAIAFALFWERVAGASVVLMRRWNSWILTAGQPPATPAAVESRHLIATGTDFLRAGVLALTGGVIGGAAIAELHPFWPWGGDAAEGVLHVAGVGVAAGALAIFGGWRERWRLVLVGVSVGVLFLAVA